MKKRHRPIGGRDKKPIPWFVRHFYCPTCILNGEFYDSPLTKCSAQGGLIPVGYECPFFGCIRCLQYRDARKALKEEE